MSKTKVSLTPADITDKWGRRLKGAVADIQKGIDSVDVSPGEKAAAASDKMLANTTEAIANGRWGRAVAKMPLAEWKNLTKAKVAQRLAGGVDGAMGKRREFDNYLANTINSVLPTIAAMPDATIEDSKARVGAFMDHMHNNPFK